MTRSLTLICRVARRPGAWLAAMAIVIAAGCQRTEAPPPPSPPADAQPMPLKLGVSRSIFSAPMFIAADKGFFAAEGLDVSITHFQSGKATLAGVIDESVDVGTSADAALVSSALECDCFRILATFAYSHTNNKIVARRDRGIAAVTDLVGKRLGVALGTTGEYYALYGLLADGVDPGSVSFVDMQTSQLPTAIANGEVDAISTWEPNIWRASHALGDQAIVFVNREVLRHTFNLATRPAFADEHPELLVRLLRATQRAASFVTQHPEEAREIIARSLDVPADYLEQTLPDYQYGVGLDQFLILTMESEARWSQGTRGGTGPIPNFLQLIDSRALKASFPESVRLIE
ncbi:MAG: ABC transporter substrate-binding protein [Rhodocyclaceae bacterium]|nr:ABC transporter substrate-binding protein [Rhodocyclaceae bacterium]